MKTILKFSSAVIIITASYFYAHPDFLAKAAGEEDIPQKEIKINKEEDGSNAESNEESKGHKGNKRLLELPGKLRGCPERIISHTGYTLSFNREHNQPNWVAWELTDKETNGHIQRTDDFQPDPLVPKPHQVTTEDYKKSGYDRGHMAPAADMKWSGKAMAECFYMSNMCPQNGSLNSGAWGTLEKACRRWAQQEGNIYIVCGPIFNKNKKHKTIGKDHKITVPDAFFKVVLSMRPNKEKTIGFYYSNRSGKQPMSETATSVDEIETITGIDFFVNIPDKLEQKIESEYSLKQWN